MTSVKGTWSDYDCDQKLRYVCKISSGEFGINYGPCFDTNCIFVSLNMLHLLNTITQHVLYFHIFETIIVFKLSP